MPTPRGHTLSSNGPNQASDDGSANCGHDYEQYKSDEFEVALFRSMVPERAPCYEKEDNQ